MKRKAIVTVPPYAPHMNEVLDHPLVSGIRLNTVMPVKGSLEDVLKRMNDGAKTRGKDFWIDLKCRQLRVKDFGVPPFTEITLSHNISVYTPCRAYFSDRSESATVLEVDGNRLIMQEGPNRVVGPGESVTIPHLTLKVEGYLTDMDKRYIEAGNRVGVDNFMLSFVEGQEDVDEFRKYNKDANVAAKIESVRGIDYVKDGWDGTTRLMAARGDLFQELKWPHMITETVERILYRDPNAILASRVLNSLQHGPEPSCSDIGDVDNHLRMGYMTFMFGDEICLKRDSIMAGLNVLGVMASRYDRAAEKGRKMTSNLN